MKRTILSRKRVKVLAAEREMTLRQVGIAAGMGPEPSYFYQILDKDTPRLRTLARITKVLGCRIDDIIEEKGVDDDPKSVRSDDRGG